jgi:hypothetical protein
MRRSHPVNKYKYANPAQTGAIGYFRPGLDWEIINNEVRYNHGSGIKFKGSALILTNYVHDNGDFGIECGDGNTEAAFGGHLESNGKVINDGLPEWGYWGGYAATNAVVANNTISHNNVILGYWEGKDIRFNPAWGAGGTKFSQAENLLVFDNIVDDNSGSGLWSDFSYDGTVYLGNVVRKNYNLGGGALFHEVSGSADVVCNTVRNNTFLDPVPPRSAAVFISNSRHVDVRFNDITARKDYSVDDVKAFGGNGISVDDAGYRTNEELPALAFEDHVHQNRIVFMNDYGTAGASGSTGNIIANSADVTQLLTVTFDSDLYHTPALTQKHWTWVGNDLQQQFFSLADFQNELGQERHGSVDEILRPISGSFYCDVLRTAAHGRIASRH